MACAAPVGSKQYEIQYLLKGTKYPSCVVIVHRTLPSSTSVTTHRATAEWLSDHLMPGAFILLNDVPPTEQPLSPEAHSATVRIAEKIRRLTPNIYGFQNLIPEEYRQQFLDIAAYEACLELCVHSSKEISPDVWEQLLAQWDSAFEAGTEVVEELEQLADKPELHAPQQSCTLAARLKEVVNRSLRLEGSQVVVIFKWEFDSVAPLLTALQHLSFIPTVIALNNQGLADEAQAAIALEERFLEQASGAATPVPSDSHVQ